MREQADIRAILKSGKLSSELELERAIILERKLRLMIKDHPELAESRKELRSIIADYEKLNWSKDADIPKSLIKESDEAEQIAEHERVFIENRKKAIKDKLREMDLTQQDLGALLGHGKTYISELVNGISPFVMRDLIIIHRLLGIKLEKLIPTVISHSDRKKLKANLSDLNRPELKLDGAISH
ncbi:MAG: helix-turn-helix domain-containing protein [Cryomorphaceae bacterium]|nr:helix-turn-helix domain-containing protein [Flavobacteriales bacterium]